jgi:hypothetical protein
MKPRLVTAVLLSLLVVGASVLGLTLSGSGNSSGSSNGGQSGQNTTSSGKGSGVAATLVVRAQGIGQQFLYSAGTLGQTFSNMFVPLKGLPVTITREVPAEVSNRDRPRPQNFKTNSSGIAEIKEPAGDYSILIVGQSFTLNTTLVLRANLTATLEMQLIPSFATVNSLQVVGRDSSSALEPTSTIYVNVDSGVKAAQNGYFVLVGQVVMNALVPSGPVVRILGYADVNATATGRYDSSGGSWVVLAPLGAYEAYPNANVLLVQYVPTYMVSYRAD